jgi:galacturonosyltransferase
VDELFSAMERLCEEGMNCALDVLGGYEEDYEAVIRRYAEKGWLHYHGYQVDVRPFIEQAHCFVLPSYHEGMANTNLECAAMGRPVITSDIPGCKEAVIDGQSGILCRVRDPESLYDAMSHFLQLSAAEKEAMGVAGRRHMEEIFDKRRVVAETERHLEMK